MMRGALLAALLALAACVSAQQYSNFDAIPPEPSARAVAAATLWETPVFTAMPNARDFADAYPRDALATHISGRVSLGCIVQAGGALACRAYDDGERRFDFERAALLVCTRFRVAETDQSGASTIGRRVNRTILFVTG